MTHFRRERLDALKQKDENGLLPCKCGNAARTINVMGGWLIVCSKSCWGHPQHNENDAIKEWNTRSREAALIALCEDALREVEVRSDLAAFWKAEAKSILIAGVKRLAEHGIEVDSVEMHWEVQKYREKLFLEQLNIKLATQAMKKNGDA